MTGHRTCTSSCYKKSMVELHTIELGIRGWAQVTHSRESANENSSVLSCDAASDCHGVKVPVPAIVKLFCRTGQSCICQLSACDVLTF